MPTLYWLVGSVEVAAVSTLEAEAVIDVVEELIGLDAIDAIHQRYKAQRDALMPPDHTEWVELKATGKVAEPHQLREHKRMRGMCQTVFVVDSKEGVDALFT